ncbi:MAG: hypothetical protein GY824_01820, partial [Delftia sp.]|nr:hypothetical protein [Delftia sp.]
MSDLLPVVEYATRVERTQALLAERGLEGIVVFSGARERGGRVAYLCNHRLAQPAAINRAGLDFAALVLPARGAGVLVAPAGYDDGLGTGVESGRAGGALVSEIVEAVEGYCQGASRWGLAGLDVIPAAHYVKLTEALSALEWAPADAILAEQRQIKSAAEIAALEQSAGVAQAGLQAGLAAAIPGARQRQLELAARRGC